MPTSLTILDLYLKCNDKALFNVRISARRSGNGFGRIEELWELGFFLKGAEGFFSRGRGAATSPLRKNPEPLITHKMPKWTAPPRIPCYDSRSDIRYFRILLSIFPELSESTALPELISGIHDYCAGLLFERAGILFERAGILFERAGVLFERAGIHYYCGVIRFYHTVILFYRTVTHYYCGVILFYHTVTFEYRAVILLYRAVIGVSC